MHRLRETADHFHVVFVCTGNRARSPLAEALFLRYAAGIDATARSIGTLELEGAPALPEAVEAARRLGVDLSSHASRPLRKVDLSSAVLVLGFEPAHLAASVVDGHADISRTFLLGEIVRLLAVPIDEPERIARARLLVSIADARRVRSRPDPASVVPDPLGKPSSVMRATAERIDRLVRELVSGLFDARS